MLQYEKEFMKEFGRNKKISLNETGEVTQLGGYGLNPTVSSTVNQSSVPDNQGPGVLSSALNSTKNFASDIYGMGKSVVGGIGTLASLPWKAGQQLVNAGRAVGDAADVASAEYNNPDDSTLYKGWAIPAQSVDMFYNSYTFRNATPEQQSEMMHNVEEAKNKAVADANKPGVMSTVMDTAGKIGMGALAGAGIAGGLYLTKHVYDNYKFSSIGCSNIKDPSVKRDCELHVINKALESLQKSLTVCYGQPDEKHCKELIYNEIEKALAQKQQLSLSYS